MSDEKKVREVARAMREIARKFNLRLHGTVQVTTPITSLYLGTVVMECGKVRAEPYDAKE